MIFRKVIKSPYSKEDMYKNLPDSKIKQLSENEFAVWSVPLVDTRTHAKSIVKEALNVEWLSYNLKEFLSSTKDLLVELLSFLVKFIIMVVLILFFPVYRLSCRILPVKVITIEKTRA